MLDDALCLTGAYGPAVLNCGLLHPQAPMVLAGGDWGSYRLLAVSDGAMRIDDGEGSERYPAGSACFLAPGRALQVHFAPGCTVGFVIFDVTYQPRQGSAGRMVHVAPAGRQPGPRRVWGVVPPRRVPSPLASGVAELIAQIRAGYWRGPIEHARASARLALWLSEYLLAARHDDGAGNTEVDPFIAAEVYACRLGPNLPSVTELAARCGMSREHFSRAFKRARGISPSEFLDNERWQQARRLLGDTDESLARIARLLGYNSLSAFSRAFRRQSHCSPRQYRRRHRFGH